MKYSRNGGLWGARLVMDGETVGKLVKLHNLVNYSDAIGEGHGDRNEPLGWRGSKGFAFS